MFDKKKTLLQQEKNLKLELKILSEQQAINNKKNERISDFTDFIDKAVKLDMKTDKWNRLAVNINEPVSYLELEEILNQCSNNNSFYFKPEFIEIKKQEKSTIPDTTKRKKSSPGKNQDVNLNLKGTFIVKNK